MRKTILAGLIAATLVPVAAQAQVIDRRERAELNRDRREVREERRELNQAYRSGDPRAIREERRELRGAQQEFRDERRDALRDGGNWGRNDWRGYRNTNRNLYRGYGFRSDYRYQTFRPGIRIGVGYYAPRYYINDYNRYRLPRPGFNQRWVRHYNDVLLVDTRRGIVIDVIRSFYW
jgi:Ni/Co efflux regulator RcnB